MFAYEYSDYFFFNGFNSLYPVGRRPNWVMFIRIFAQIILYNIFTIFYNLAPILHDIGRYDVML